MKIITRSVAAATLTAVALGAGTVAASAPPEDEPVEPKRFPGLEIQLLDDDPFLNPPAELCDSYLTLRRLVAPAGDDSADIVDAYMIVQLEESGGWPNLRLTDDDRDRVREAFAGCDEA